jgi:hypothetical protein
VAIEPRPEQLTFTFSHSNSLRRLGEEPAAVAFVWDDALRAAPETATRVRRRARRREASRVARVEARPARVATEGGLIP